MQRIRVIDSHTGGEPTRVVVEGVPDLGKGPLGDRLIRFRREFDPIRSAVVNEPRGSDILVGAILVAPHDPSCDTGVLFFNNVGPLGMCGHGTIGLVETLKYLGRIGPGELRIDTPVGMVTARLHEDGEVSVQNVLSYRLKSNVPVDVEGHGVVHGDVAWGGNWFFLVSDHGQELEIRNSEALTEFSWKVREALLREGISGAEGAEIDHIELFGASSTGADSRNFVLCPGKAYDRSPCGTGTSAKLACLFADGKLAPGQEWRQESITGSCFTGSVEPVDGGVLPTIRGRAFVNADSTLLLDPEDPLCFGIRTD